MITQKEYWDKKIKEWTEGSYEKKTKNLIEKIANFFRGGIIKRMDVAIELVGPKVRGKTVLDLGCGLGDFCFKVMPYKPGKVIGIDVSPVAIKEAAKRAKKSGFKNEIEFLQGDITQIKKLPDFDIAVGLGFIDYLDKDGMRHLFKLLNGRKFIFSMFEKKLSLLTLAHELYVKIQKCPGAYKYTRKEIRQLIPRGTKLIFLEKDKMLFITTSPR